MTTDPSRDVVVVGAGVFGAWIAYELVRAKCSVTLVDAHGPAHTRASSGGESRVIRMGYGDQALYSRWSIRSLERWSAFAAVRRQPLLHRTGVLRMAAPDDPLTRATLTTLRTLQVRVEELDRAELGRRYPQMALANTAWGILEPDSGVLMARRAVQAVVEAAVELGLEYRHAAVLPPARRLVDGLRTRDGDTLRAGTYVFACGAWLPALFPRLLDGRIVPTRQEVFYFGCPPGDRRFAPPALPAWIDFGEEIYGVPDLDGRGLKVAIDRHGPVIDPDSADRTTSATQLTEARDFLSRRFPDLAAAPLLATHVCHYENTSNGDFLIDRHPGHPNVWLAGGGSGHGFKHGPAVGEYVAERILREAPVDHRFTLGTKETVFHRTIF